MTRIVVTVTLFACLLGASACADSTAPAQAGGAKKAPPRASNTRYILASGDILPPNCQDLGNGYWLCNDEPEAARVPSSKTDSGSDNSENSNSDY